MAKTKALISFAVTAKLICVFVFVYANYWFSHAKAHLCFPLFIFSDINECASNPCVHGSCDDKVNDYECDCEDGYNGKNCDHSKSQIFFLYIKCIKQDND